MLWQHTCPQFDQWAEEDRAAPTQRYQLSAGQICSDGRMKPENGTRALAYAREITRQDIGNLGQFLPCPFTWDDMVISEELLDWPERSGLRSENASAVLGSTRNSAALSTGDGSDCAAQRFAWHGKDHGGPGDRSRTQTGLVPNRSGARRQQIHWRDRKAPQRNLLPALRELSAILLFDEADALFAKRTQVKDSHDRYANADTSYLLQLLEEFRGLALLTTNKRGNIDPAFYRRLRYVYEFPKPGAKDRLEIWQRLTAELYGDETRAALAATPQKLAERDGDLAGPDQGHRPGQRLHRAAPGPAGAGRRSARERSGARWPRKAAALTAR